MKEKTKGAFIRQECPLGYRVEFDFGEVKFDITGKVKTYYLAVSPFLPHIFIGFTFIPIRNKRSFKMPMFSFLK